MGIGRMEKYCLKNGHTWALYSDVCHEGFVISKCLRCGAKQLGYIEEEDYEPDLDADCSEEQTE